MPTLYLIRHGRAAAGFGEDHDPGLDEMGRTQALKASDTLRTLTPMPIISSPLKRCQETAVPLASAWQTSPTIVESVAEIPSPMEDLKARSEWLRKLMPGDWSHTGKVVLTWRQGVIDALSSLTQDTVVFSHFIAINVAAGHALGSDKVICFKPDNASITKLRVNGPQFEVLDLGGEASTQIR